MRRDRKTYRRARISGRHWKGSVRSDEDEGDGSDEALLGMSEPLAGALPEGSPRAAALLTAESLLEVAGLRRLELRGLERGGGEKTRRQMSA